MELLLLGGGVVAMGITGGRLLSVGFVLLVAMHYAASWSRVQWLIG
jgi:hypothetical protein